jgi:hypothetical protein
MRDNSTGGMRRTGQIPRLAEKRRVRVNVGPTITEQDLVLVLLTRQRMAIKAGLEALEYDEANEVRGDRDRDGSVARKHRLKGYLALHEEVARWLPVAWRTEDAMQEWAARGRRFRP